MENIDYKRLYLKYKKKYLNLKNQIGGAESKIPGRSRNRKRGCCRASRTAWVNALYLHSNVRLDEC